MEPLVHLKGDELSLLVIQLEDDVTHRLGYVCRVEENWIRLKNLRWRPVTLG